MKRGYSLLELMVAIFILASLVGIAIPVYIDQVNKGRISAALITLQALEQTAKTAYEENPSNTSITYGGVTLENNVITAITADSVINALYIRPSGNPNVSATQFLVCVYVGNLNFSNYQTPTSGTAGAYARICKQDTASDPIYTNMCGSLQGGALDVPVKYLPTGCNCTNIWGGTC